MIWFYPKSCITLKIFILVAYTTYVEDLWVQCFVHIWKSILSSCLFHHQIRYLARFVKSHISWIGNQCHTSIIDHKNNNTIDKLVWLTISWYLSPKVHYQHLQLGSLVLHIFCCFPPIKEISNRQFDISKVDLDIEANTLEK